MGEVREAVAKWVSEGEGGRKIQEEDRQTDKETDREKRREIGKVRGRQPN